MDRNKRPSRVGLASCPCGRNAAQVIDLVLDDMAEAGAVYERQGATENPVEFVRGTTAGCDAVALGMDGTDARFGDRLGELEAGCAVYAVCACAGCAAEEALGCLGALEEACEQHGLLWRGGLAIEDAQAVAPFEHSPRLGFWRRPVSGAVDRLLLAVRCGGNAGLFATRQGPLRRAFAWVLLRMR